MTKTLRIRKRKNLNLFLYREYENDKPLYEESKATADTLSKKFKLDKDLFEHLHDGECKVFKMKNRKYQLDDDTQSKESIKDKEKELNDVILGVINVVQSHFLIAEDLDEFDVYIQDDYNIPLLYKNPYEISYKEEILQNIARTTFLIIRDNYIACPTIHDFYTWLFENIDITVSYKK